MQKCQSFEGRLTPSHYENDGGVMLMGALAAPAAHFFGMDVSHPLVQPPGGRSLNKGL